MLDILDAVSFKQEIANSIWKFYKRGRTTYFGADHIFELGFSTSANLCCSKKDISTSCPWDPSWTGPLVLLFSALAKLYTLMPTSWS
jgi:hypothetical protein